MCEPDAREILANQMITATRELALGNPWKTSLECTAAFVEILPEFLAEFVVGVISCDTDTMSGELRLKYLPPM